MMNKMTEEEGAACMHNVQCTTNMVCHATRRRLLPMGGVAQEREEGRKGARERERQLLPSITC